MCNNLHLGRILDFLWTKRLSISREYKNGFQFVGNIWFHVPKRLSICWQYLVPCTKNFQFVGNIWSHVSKTLSISSQYLVPCTKKAFNLLAISGPMYQKGFQLVVNIWSHVPKTLSISSQYLVPCTKKVFI